MGGSIHVVERQCRCEKGGVESSGPHYVHGAHTQSCAEDTRHRFRAGQGISEMVLDGIQKGTRGSRYMDRKPRGQAALGRGEGVGGLQVRGGRDQTTCKKEQI